MQFRVLLLVLTWTVFASASQENGVVLKGESREVVLDVVARDKHGRILRDLRADELRIVDDGVDVKPTSFRLVAGSEAAKTSPQSAQPRLFTLLFEQFGPEGRALAKEAAMTLVKTAAGPHVFFSVVAAGTRTTLYQPYTDNAELARQAIERVTSGPRKQTAFEAESASSQARPAGGITVDQQRLSNREGFQGDSRGIESILARMATNMVDAPADAAYEVRGDPALRVILALAEGANSIPGRKTVVYFCEGLQVPESRRPQFRAVLQAANRANLTVYPIDVSGLDYELSNMGPSNLAGAAAFMDLPQNRTTPDRVARGDSPNSSAIRNSDLKMRDIATENSRTSHRGALAELAASTGGFFVSNTNNMKPNARRIAEEALTYFEVTYTPPAGPLDGHFRPISVTTVRPNVKVQSRNGYLAVPSLPGRPVQAFELPLLKELSSAEPRHDFPHDAAVIPVRGSENGVEVTVLVQTPFRELRFEEDPRASVCRIHGAILALVRDSTGKVIQRFALDGPFQAPLDRIEAYRNSPWLMEERTVLAPGDYVLETVVSDRQADRSSVERREFKVEPWDPGPHISALTYVRGVASVPSDSKRPFQSGGKAIEPELGLRLPGGAGTTATVYFLAHAAAGSTAPVTVDVEVLKDGSPISRGVVFEGPMKGESPLLSKLDLSKIPGSNYQVRARVSQEGKTAVSMLPLTIVEWKDSTAEMPASGSPITFAANKPEQWNTAPPSGAQKELLAAARSHAASYADKMPNFTCLQITRRLEDAGGKRDWRQKDEYSEVITWVNSAESYGRVGGRAKRQKRNDAVRVSSYGEFASLLRNIFLPESHADFRWLRSETVRGHSADVFAYRVDKAHSQYNVTYRDGKDRTVRPAYRGVVTIDSRTAETLHLEADVEQMPEDMKVQELHLSVDYEPTDVAGRDYLLPSSATLMTRIGKKLLVRNEMRFSGYRRFQTESSVRYAEMAQ